MYAYKIIDCFISMISLWIIQQFSDIFTMSSPYQYGFYTPEILIYHV